MNSPVSVNILGKEYQIACQDDQKDALYASARMVDEGMTSIRNAGKVVGVERIAVLAALNIASDLVELQANQQLDGHDLDKTITKLKQRIERFLEESRQLEL